VFADYGDPFNSVSKFKPSLPRSQEFQATAVFTNTENPRNGKLSETKKHEVGFSCFFQLHFTPRSYPFRRSNVLNFGSPPKKDLNFLPSLTAKDVIFSGFV
jgi:hypothetical protein